ncbi:hypothetical protein ACQKWADRAFT_277833 [Trichoderma austrokoningii]
MHFGVEGGDRSAPSRLFSWPMSTTGFCINKASLAHGPTRLNRESLEHRCCTMKESKHLHSKILSLGKTYEWWLILLQYVQVYKDKGGCKADSKPHSQGRELTPHQ